MGGLQEKVALVTGAARRIGAAVAEALHGHGMNVVIHYHRSEDEARALAARLERARADSTLLARADLLDEKAPARLIDSTLARFSGLDLLVNNASTFYPTAVGETGRAAWRDLFGTNVEAPFFLSQAAAASLAERGGSIVNLADIHGLRPTAGYPVYCTAKAGLVMLTRALALELAPRVRVNAIAPGIILWADGEEPDLQTLAERVPLERMGTTAEIVSALVYLARDATYTSGQVLTVDGGRHV